MRQITIKLITTLLTLVFCIGCFTACNGKKTQDDKNTNSTENSIVDKDNSEIINAATDKIADDENNKTDENSQIVDTSKTETTNTESKQNTSSVNKNMESTNKDVSNNTSKTPTQGINNTVCSHKDTTLENRKEATTTSEGYTGDTVCKTCGIVVANGQTIPKIVENYTPGKVTYTTNNGYKYVVDEGTDITEYSMKQQTKHIDSPYRAAELEILRLCNEERAKNGLAPLTWFEDAYYFTHIRAEEIYIQWGHPRPDWSEWHTVYTDAGVILHCSYGENLARFQGPSPETVAEIAVEGWMDSPGHRANILNPQYTKMTLSLEYGADNFTLCAVQHFFG